MTRLRFILLAAVIAAGCGDNSISGPDQTAFTGRYTFVLEPDVGCWQNPPRMFKTMYTLPVVSITKDASDPYFRATLPGGELSFLYDPTPQSASIVAGYLNVQSCPVSSNEHLSIILPGVDGRVESRGGRLSVDGLAHGDLSIVDDATQKSQSCTGYHRWSLNPS